MTAPGKKESRTLAAGCVAIEKRFQGKYPETICGMPKKGREALALYAEMLKPVTKVTEGVKED